MAQTRHVYTTLSTSLREIRLLQILPDSDPNSLKCELSVHSLKAPDAVPYTALSYVWGQPDPSGNCIILLNGHKRPVTPNLLQALQSFHALGHVDYLWADAICIQQSDLEEKMSQVSMMDSIYASATKTIIWLGPSGDDSDAGMELLANLKDGDLAVPQFDARLRKGLLAVTKLMQRQWWTRTWILQEVFLSRNPVARCGVMEVPFTRFVFLKKHSDQAYWSTQGKWRGLTLFERVPFTYCLSNWDITKAQLGSPRRSSLLSWIISMSYQLDATEMRDKVYALLSLVSDGDRAAIRPDYKRPMRDILIDVTRQSMKLEGLMFLNVVEPEDMKPPDLKLPSWVPYLFGGHSTQNLVGYKPPFEANYGGHCNTWVELFRDSKVIASNPTSELSQDRENVFLFLDGIQIDEVTFAGPMPHVPEYRGPDELTAAKVKAKRVRATIDTIRNWELEALQEPPQPAKGCYDALGGRKEAFWRTLACDGSTTRIRPLSPDCGHRFNAFMGRCPPLGREVVVDETLQDDWVREYAVPVVAKTMHRSFILTRQGRMGLAVRGVANGDLVIIAQDCDVPLIVRRSTDHCFKFIGEAYVHGIMDGEAVSQASKQGLKIEKFCLR